MKLLLKERFNNVKREFNALARDHHLLESDPPNAPFIQKCMAAVVVPIVLAADIALTFAKNEAYAADKNKAVKEAHSTADKRRNEDTRSLIKAAENFI
jgi:hypothetical protein